MALNGPNSKMYHLPRFKCYFCNRTKSTTPDQEKPKPNKMETYLGCEPSCSLMSVKPTNQEKRVNNCGGTYLQAMGYCIHLEEGGHAGHGGEAGKVLRWLVERVMGRARLGSESCVHSLQGPGMRGYWWSWFRPHTMKGALGREHITSGLEPKWGR